MSKKQAIYIELKNWVIIPTRFPDNATALRALNEPWFFVSVWDSTYNKAEIKRTFPMWENEMLLKMSQQTYDVQLMLWAIAQKRIKDWKIVKSFEQIMDIFKRQKWEYWWLKDYNDLPFFAHVQQSDDNALWYNPDADADA